MQPRWATWRGAVRALAVLAICGPGGVADPRPAKADPPKPLPEDLVAAWKKAGAEVGWMRVNKIGIFPEEEGKAGDLPAFRFSPWKRGVLAKLPAPEGAFGLYLSGTAVTDAGMKELAGLNRLQSLYLFHTAVTDVGLKELAPLKALQSLNLTMTAVTDAGLKELAELKGLQTLVLCQTLVTDAGLKELAGLNRLQTLDLSFTQVTDGGLKELAGLKGLQRLDLHFTKKVTDAGMRELREALPGCRIYR